MCQFAVQRSETLTAVDSAGGRNVVAQLLYASLANLLILPKVALARLTFYLLVLDLDEPDDAAC